MVTKDRDRKVISNEELQEKADNVFSGREARPCERCNKMWKPGIWNFHNLCNTCFDLFDTQKMAGRHGKNPNAYESSTVWIKDNPYE